jgi:hypothetical protein
MKNKIITLSLTGLMLVNASPLRTTVTDPDEMKELDRCVQKRFQDRRSFGMSRMGPRRSPSPSVYGRPSSAGSSYHRDVRSFSSENPAEQSVIDALHAKSYEVLVYLAGRKILQHAPEKTTIRHRYGVQGPALITNKAMPADPPSTRWLLSESRTALESFEIGDGYTLKRGPWMVTMRPLRATNSGCVSCHTTGIASGPERSKTELAIGDAIGVAIYAYRKTADATE